MQLDLALTGDAIDALLGPAPAPNRQQAPEPSDELGRLSRRIAGQYAPILATFAAEFLHSSAPPESTEAATAALDNLVRLSAATRDTELRAHLDALRAHIGQPVPRRGTARQRALDDLKERLLAIAACLDSDDGEPLRRVFLARRRATPLLQELADIPGIGPRRLDRLYRAGLFTVEALRGADPTDVASVTGLPARLAEEVVRATRDFATRYRQECAEDLDAVVEELLRQLARAEETERQEIVGRLSQTTGRLRAALATTEGGTG